MTNDAELRPFRDQDRRAFERLIAHGFAVPADGARAFVERIPAEHVRLLGAPAIACAALLPFGQWFGGQRLDMVGIQVVSVMPEARGRGIGRTIMESVVRELADRRLRIPNSLRRRGVGRPHRRVRLDHSQGHPPWWSRAPAARPSCGTDLRGAAHRPLDAADRRSTPGSAIRWRRGHWRLSRPTTTR